VLDEVAVLLRDHLRMAPLAGLSVSLGAPGRSILGDSVSNGRMSGMDLNSSTLWMRTSWKAHGVCAVRGTVLVGGSGGRRTPAYIYSRDRVVGFGKNKGSMLGTLSSR